MRLSVVVAIESPPLDGGIGASCSLSAAGWGPSVDLSQDTAKAPTDLDQAGNAAGNVEYPHPTVPP